MARITQVEFADRIPEFQASIQRLCRGILKDPRWAEDAAQTTMFLAWRRVEGFEGRSDLETWLSRIARNVCRDFFRKRNCRPEGFLEVSKNMEYGPIQHLENSLPDPSPNPFMAASHSELCRELYQIIKDLPRKFRIYFILRRVKGLNEEETAKMLQVSVPTVKSRDFRAMAIVRAEMLKRGYRTTAEYLSDY